MKKDTPWYIRQSPKLGSAYQHFRNVANDEGVLDPKTRELLMVALASVYRCPHCVEDHIHRAQEAGATKQEITEALLIAAFEGAGTQLAWRKEVFSKLLGEET
ncbi:MAG TPA: carboxymuconolactone decarboxylase family protein [bacterium]|nr:carboxymuconolactone decarboxylase family protein [bacterium]